MGGGEFTSSVGTSAQLVFGPATPHLSHLFGSLAGPGLFWSPEGKKKHLYAFLLHHGGSRKGPVGLIGPRREGEYQRPEAPEAELPDPPLGPPSERF